MDEQIQQTTHKLTRQEISDAVTDLGWRYILGVVRTCVRVGSFARAAYVVERIVAALGTDADECLRADIRSDRLILTLQSFATGQVTQREIDLAGQISAAVSRLGLTTDADVHDGAPRSAQVMEIAIDALDIAAVRPFWQAVMGYIDDPGDLGNALADPIGQDPTIWFQQMDAPRPQRNRIHFDVSVPHDEAASRIQSALAAGGTLLSDAEAPAFWILADPEGNEACVTTWQGRDAPS